MATIAVMAALHFVVSYVSALLFGLLQFLFGPLAIFVEAIASTGIGSLLAAITITLFPRPGTATLLLVTVSFLNGIFGGYFGLPSWLFVLATAAIYECVLAAMGVTVGPTFRRPAKDAPGDAIIRGILAIGLAKGTALGLQYVFQVWLYRFYYSVEYMLAVALIGGLLYAAIGTAIGIKLGYRLRRVAL
jgi:hypothetical protein